MADMPGKGCVPPRLGIATLTILFDTRERQDMRPDGCLDEDVVVTHNPGENGRVNIRNPSIWVMTIPYPQGDHSKASPTS